MKMRKASFTTQATEKKVEKKSCNSRMVVLEYDT